MAQQPSDFGGTLITCSKFYLFPHVLALPWPYRIVGPLLVYSNRVFLAIPRAPSFTVLLCRRLTNIGTYYVLALLLPASVRCLPKFSSLTPRIALQFYSCIAHRASLIAYGAWCMEHRTFCFAHRNSRRVSCYTSSSSLLHRLLCSVSRITSLSASCIVLRRSKVPSHIARHCTSRILHRQSRCVSRTTCLCALNIVSHAARVFVVHCTSPLKLRIALLYASHIAPCDSRLVSSAAFHHPHILRPLGIFTHTEYRAAFFFSHRAS